MSGRFPAAGSKWLLLPVMALLLAGCATHRIDWQARIGTYTLDQAVLELGPPDKSYTLTDGTIVAEWLSHHGSTYYSSPFAYGYYPGFYGPYYSYAETSPDSYIRLTFGPDKKLRDWKRVYK